jgi:hypothetical protein
VDVVWAAFGEVGRQIDVPAVGLDAFGGLADLCLWWMSAEEWGRWKGTGVLTSLNDKETLGSRTDRTTLGIKAARAVGTKRPAMAQDLKEPMLEVGRRRDAIGVPGFQRERNQKRNLKEMNARRCPSEG